ncbi:hypothetical protein SCALM49S_01153 [Streptomyces californicus]
MSATRSAPDRVGDLVVSGIGVVTPWSDTPADAAVATGRPSEPGDWFDHRERLGRRGYKYLPTATQYFLAAARSALADAGRRAPIRTSRTSSGVVRWSGRTARPWRCTSRWTAP